MPLFSNNNTNLFFIHIPKCGGTSIENAIKIETHTISFFKESAGCLPCCPQHLHATWIESLFPSIYSNNNYFTIVRHPVSRMISEYFHDYRKRKLKFEDTLEFNEWVEETLSRYKLNPYLNDNHIRPQSEFIMPNTKIFRFENGLLAPINFALKSLHYHPMENIPHEKNWDKFSLSINKKTIDDICDFYELDFQKLMYKRINIETDIITLDDLKAKIKSSTRDISNKIITSEIKIKPKKELSIEKFVDFIRDKAISCENDNLEKSNTLMSLAHEFRPDGKFILQKLDTYKQRLEDDKSEPKTNRMLTLLNIIKSKFNFL